MAAPPSVNTKAFSGTFFLNKDLSDNPDEILRLQGVVWWKRRAISLFSPTVRVKHTIDEAGMEHLDVDQIISGVAGLKEQGILDAQERDHDHLVYGFVTAKLRRISVEEIEDEYLKKDWAQDCIEDGIVLAEGRSMPGKNSYTWRSMQVWGFAMVNGERRYATRAAFTSPLKEGGPIYVCLVYDYRTESHKLVLECTFEIPVYVPDSIQMIIRRQ